MEVPIVSFMSHQSVAPPAEDGDDADGHLPPADGIDWSSPDQVASHVSKTTLAGMQKLWRSHAAAMDVQGRAFAQTVFSLHSQALKEVAAMKTFEPKLVTAVLNTFTAGVREEVLKIFQVMRQADDSFAQGLHQTSRKAFTRNLRDALEAKDAATAEKIRRLKVSHEQALAQQRSAAVVSLQQDAALQKQEITRQLKEENRKKLAEAITAITTQLNKQYAAHVAAAAAAAAADSADNVSVSGSVTRPVTAKSIAPSTPVNIFSGGFNLSGGGLDLGGGGGGGGSGGGGGGVTLELLQALAQQDDDNIGSVLARKEMEATVKAANQATEELKLQVEDLTILVQQERSDIEAWKDKWTQESSKTDAIKRECLQIITKCEKRVKSLQEEHHEEMGKRDTIVQRSKDTILRLEAQLAQLTGQPADPRLTSYDSPGRAQQASSSVYGHPPHPYLAAGGGGGGPAGGGGGGVVPGADGGGSGGPPLRLSTTSQGPLHPPSLQTEPTLAGFEAPTDHNSSYIASHPSLPPMPHAPGGSHSVSASPTGGMYDQHSFSSQEGDGRQSPGDMRFGDGRA